MQPSKLFFELITAVEGFKLKAYLDSKNIPTIGIGTTVYPDGTKVQMGDTCTVDQAQSYMMHHIATINAPDYCTQPQYDSILCLIYNIGQGAFNASTLKRILDAGEKDAAAITAAFLMWDMVTVNGEKIPSEGLKRRRKCEAYLFNTGENHPTFFE